MGLKLLMIQALRLNFYRRWTNFSYPSAETSLRNLEVRETYESFGKKYELFNCFLYSENFPYKCFVSWYIRIIHNATWTDQLIPQLWKTFHTNVSSRDKIESFITQYGPVTYFLNSENFPYKCVVSLYIGIMQNKVLNSLVLKLFSGNWSFMKHKNHVKKNADLSTVSSTLKTSLISVSPLCTFDSFWTQRGPINWFLSSENIHQECGGLRYTQVIREKKFCVVL